MKTSRGAGNTQQKATLACRQCATAPVHAENPVFSPQPWHRFLQASCLLPHCLSFPSTQALAGMPRAGVVQPWGEPSPMFRLLLATRGANLASGPVAWGREGGSRALYRDRPWQDSGSSHLPRATAAVQPLLCSPCAAGGKQPQERTARLPQQHRGSQPHMEGHGTLVELCPPCPELHNNRDVTLKQGRVNGSASTTAVPSPQLRLCQQPALSPGATSHPRTCDSQDYSIPLHHRG